MYGFGYRISTLGGGGGADGTAHEFASVNAENYWDDLIAQSFDYSIYGVSEDGFKIALDNLFINGIDPVFANLYYALLFRGNTDAQKLIDAKGNITAVVVSPPTIANGWYEFDGAASYLDIGTNINALASDETDFAFVDTTTEVVAGRYFYGSSQGGSQISLIGLEAGTAAYMAHSNGTLPTYAYMADTDGTFVGIQNGVTTKIYKDDVEKASSGVAGTNGTINEFIGCYNNGGVPTGFHKGKMTCIFRGNGSITPTQAANLRAAWNTFKTATGSNW